MGVARCIIIYECACIVISLAIIIIMRTHAHTHTHRGKISARSLPMERNVSDGKIS